MFFAKYNRNMALVLLAAVVTTSVSASTKPADAASMWKEARRRAAEAQKAVHRHRQLDNSRTLQVSDQCYDDFVAFYDANPALGAALEEYHAEFADASDACFQDSNVYVCTIDEDTFPSTPIFAAACDTAGGIMYEYDYVTQCTGVVDGERLTFRETVLNVERLLSPLGFV